MGNEAQRVNCTIEAQERSWLLTGLKRDEVPSRPLNDLTHMRSRPFPCLSPHYVDTRFLMAAIRQPHVVFLMQGANRWDSQSRNYWGVGNGLHGSFNIQSTV